MPYEETAIAQLVADEMERLEFDEVWIDEIGNACGRIHGSDRELGAIALNSHLDHVDPGELTLWPFPPYGGVVRDGRIYGRGACDIKGPLAVQIHSMGALIGAGKRPKRDVVFCGVVQEEIGGAGAVFWVKHLDYQVDLIVLGEPSSNQLSIGHRGIWQSWVTFSGRSVHTSVPEQGDNPNYLLSAFLSKLNDRQGELRSHPIMGASTVAPTIIEVDTASPNVTPAWARVLLDFRTAAESADSLTSFVLDVAGDSIPVLSSPWPDSPDSMSQAAEDPIVGFYTPPESDAVNRARSAIGRGMGWQPDFTSYRFATDGRHFAVYVENLPIVGYSPAEESLAHTVEESISISMMLDSIKGHVSLLLDY